MELGEILDTLNANLVYFELAIVALFFAILLKTLGAGKTNILYIIIVSAIFIFLSSSLIVEGYTYDFESETVYIESDESNINYKDCDVIINLSRRVTNDKFDNCRIEIKSFFYPDNTNINKTSIFGTGTVRLDSTLYTNIKNSSVSTSGVLTLATNYHFNLENSSLTKINIGGIAGVWLRDFYIYNSTIGSTYILFGSSVNVDIFFSFNVFFNFSVPIDYYTLTNDTYGISYNYTIGKIWNFTKIYSENWRFVNFTEHEYIDAIKYNFSVIKNGLEVLNISGLKPNEFNHYVINSLIQLDITVKNSIGAVLTDAYVSINNNDTGNGYFLTTTGANNLINVLSGDLFFHVSFNESLTQNRIFELTLISNTIIIIYLNNSDVIEYDKELIDYQIEQQKTLWEDVLINWFYIVFVLIIVLAMAYLIWKTSKGFKGKRR